MTKPAVDNITIEHVLAVRNALRLAHASSNLGPSILSPDDINTLTLAYFTHRQTGVLNEIAKSGRDLALGAR